MIAQLKATTGRSFLFSSPPTPPHKIQITTPFGSNEIILMEETGADKTSTSNQSICFGSQNNICCLCSHLIPNSLSRSASQISSSSSGKFNLAKNFKMDASPQFSDSKSSVSGSEHIYFKTARSKSYCCQSTSMACESASGGGQIDQNFLNASFNAGKSVRGSSTDATTANRNKNAGLKYNLSLTSSFQSFASADDKNKLNLPGRFCLLLLLKVIICDQWSEM